MRLIFLISFCLLAYGAEAQVYKKDTILYRGAGSRIDFVYIGDGYQQAEQNSFFANAQYIHDRIFEVSPFKEYKNYFNAFSLHVPSAQSGARHPFTTNDCSPVFPKQN